MSYTELRLQRIPLLFGMPNIQMWINKICLQAHFGQHPQRVRWSPWMLFPLRSKQTSRRATCNPIHAHSSEPQDNLLYYHLKLSPNKNCIHNSRIMMTRYDLIFYRSSFFRITALQRVNIDVTDSIPRGLRNIFILDVGYNKPRPNNAFIFQSHVQYISFPIYYHEWNQHYIITNI
jgi:hypothetical protein